MIWWKYVSAIISLKCERESHFFLGINMVGLGLHIILYYTTEKSESFTFPLLNHTFALFHDSNFNNYNSCVAFVIFFQIYFYVHSFTYLLQFQV